MRGWFIECRSCGLLVPLALVSDDSVFLANELRHVHFDQRVVACPAPAALVYIGRRAERTATVAPFERCVVWKHPITGEVRYPGRNDVPMPQRYQRAGYQRHELTSLRALQQFERERGVVNEAVHYDRGSGHGFNDGDPP